MFAPGLVEEREQLCGIDRGVGGELACVDEILALACEVRPEQATLVPERREEVTTEGGLDIAGNFEAVKDAVSRLQGGGIKVSLFIDPDDDQVRASSATGAEAVELHTGAYCQAWGSDDEAKELARLSEAALAAHGNPNSDT